MKVSEIMSTDLCRIDPEETLGTAATVMGERRVGSVMVCRGEHLLGILTERDMVRALSTDFDAPREPVSQWMTKEPSTVAPDADVRDALKVMVDGGFRHLPVVDGDAVVGIVSMRDVAQALAG